MQAWDALRATLNPFSIASRPRTVPAGRGAGRRVVFAVDSSDYRQAPCLGSTKKITTPPRALTPSSALIPRRSDAAARFGVDHLVRANDSCSFACVYRKAPRFPPEHGDSVSPHSLTSGALVSAAESEDPDLFRDPWARPVQVSRPSKARYRPSPPPHQTKLPLTPTHHSRIPPRTQSERDHQLRVQSERMDRERCVKAVTAHSDDAKIRGVRSVSVDVLPCNPANGVAETIVEYCDMKRADLVVVGSRGAGSLRRSMLSLVGLGSVSEHLARHLTSAALMIVKRPPVVSTTAGATHGNDSEMQKLEQEEAKTSSSA